MPPQKWPTKTTTSSEYVTDEMLTPFLGYTTQIQLSLSCRNLHNRKVFGNLDTYCKISVKKHPSQNQFEEVARTEVIKHTLDPEWIEKVVLNYNFETIQRIRFDIFDEDGNAEQLGFFETTVGELISFSGRQFVGRLQGSSKLSGEIVIVTEEVESCRQIVEIQFRIENLQYDKWFGDTNPFLVLSRLNHDGSFSVIARTEPVNVPEEPIWKPMIIPATKLCNGDFDRKIKIECFDHRSNGNHKLIGTTYTTLTLALNSSTGMLMLNKQEKQESDPTTSGALKLEKILITEEHTFLDYIRNGTQIHFAVAIDFSASNGIHTDPKSLHYLSTIPNELNQYEIALRGIGEIMEYYDRSKLFPAFGNECRFCL